MYFSFFKSKSIQTKSSFKRRLLITAATIFFTLSPQTDRIVSAQTPSARQQQSQSVDKKKRESELETRFLKAMNHDKAFALLVVFNEMLSIRKEVSKIDLMSELCLPEERLTDRKIRFLEIMTPLAEAKLLNGAELPREAGAIAEEYATASCLTRKIKLFEKAARDIMEAVSKGGDLTKGRQFIQKLFPLLAPIAVSGEDFNAYLKAFSTGRGTEKLQEQKKMKEEQREKEWGEFNKQVEDYCSSVKKAK